MWITGYLSLIWISASAESWDYGWHGQFKQVSDSVCGRNINLSYEEEKTIYLHYNGTPLNGTCVINVTVYNPLRGYSIFCVVLNNINLYPENYDCKETFRFFFGEYPAKEIKNFISCSDIRKPVCDYDANTRSYAAFNSLHASENRSTFEIKVYALTGFPKPTTDAPLLRSESTWSSWTSANNDDTMGKKKTGFIYIIIGSLAGGVLLLFLCIHNCNEKMLKAALDGRNIDLQERTDRGSQEDYFTIARENHDVSPQILIEYVSDTAAPRIDSQVSPEASPTFQDSRCEENINVPETSTPPNESPNAQMMDAPPPSYRDLFCDT